MPINQRSKGKRGEREVVKLLQKYNIIGKRNLQQTAEGGYDILLQETILSDYAMEVKNYGKWSNSLRREHWEQAIEQAEKVNKIPLLVWKINYCVWFVEYYDENNILRIEYFETWLENQCANSQRVQ